MGTVPWSHSSAVQNSGRSKSGTKAVFNNIANTLLDTPLRNASESTAAAGSNENWGLVKSGVAEAANYVANTLGGSSGGGYGGRYGGGGGVDDRLVADRMKEIARYNVDAINRQLGQQLGNYDIADAQNRSLADLQLNQNRRKTSADRFEAQRDLQNAALGLLGNMNQAMNGSSVGNLMRMLEDRNDKENNVYWAQLQSNQDQVENAYLNSVNQNITARNDAISNAQKAIADIQADLSANLNNINPDYYVAPGTGETDLGGGDLYDRRRVAANNAQISGYVMPDNRRGAERNRLLGNDYYSRLINSFNGR